MQSRKRKTKTEKTVKQLLPFLKKIGVPVKEIPKGMLGKKYGLARIIGLARDKNWPQDVITELERKFMDEKMSDISFIIDEDDGYCD